MGVAVHGLFLVFTLGIAVTAVVFHPAPGLFTRSSEDYAMLGAMVEQSMELQTRQAEILQ